MNLECALALLPSDENEEQSGILEQECEVSANDVARYIGLFRKYTLVNFSCPDASMKLSSVLGELESLVTANPLASVRQQKITDYFKASS